MAYPEIGSVEQVTVTKVAPFGALVESSDGVAGLVVGANAQKGDNLRVTVTDVDLEKQRFSAAIA
ncbi:hypothetical protein BH09ACT4_BH09ACT4_00080 [soil metagenome]